MLAIGTDSCLQHRLGIGAQGRGQQLTLRQHVSQHHLVIGAARVGVVGQALGGGQHQAQGQLLALGMNQLDGSPEGPTVQFSRVLIGLGWGCC